MSRFLDAMRDRGKHTDTGEGMRAYQGKIVDAADVLGPRASSETTLDKKVELSVEPLPDDAMQSTLGSDETATFDSESESVSWPEDDRLAAHRVDGMEQGRVLPPEIPVENTVLNKAATVTAGSASAHLNTTPPPLNHIPVTNTDGHPPPAVNQRYPSLRNLDPLFYLIVGIAAIGLFACLYALITQNDAYFEREYQQLQKESAALQARLAASAKLEAALNAAATVQKTPSVAISAEPDQPETSGDQTTEAEIALSEKNVSNKPQAQVPAVAVSQTGTAIDTAVESTNIVAAEEVQVPASEPVAVVENSTVNPALALLKQEVEELRAALTSQEQKISRLEVDNHELIASLEKPKNAVLSTALIKTLPIATSKPQSGPVQTPASSGKIVVSDSRKESNAPAVSGSQIPPTLQSPLATAETEISELVSQGYLAYQANDIQAASGFYEKALEFDPYHRDANLGVAATAQAIGKFKLAEDRYRHLLTLDPADEVAFSALLNLAGSNLQGSIIEFELAQHAEYVENPQNLQAILGNYYSQQKRWSKAESAYALAVRGAAVNPDYLFNYAVTLDNIGRIKLAAQYYSQALGYMENSEYTFDAQAARQRLDSLLLSDQ